MFSLVYVSSAVKPFTPAELVDLLARSGEKNARLGITGMLLHEGCASRLQFHATDERAAKTAGGTR
jgi:hypothetical protein